MSAVAFSADGSHLAATTSDNRLLWEVRARRNSSDSTSGEAGFRDVAYSPDGRMLAFATGRDIEIFASGVRSASPPTSSAAARTTPETGLHKNKNDIPKAQTPADVTDLFPPALRDDSRCSSEGLDGTGDLLVTCLLTDYSPLLAGLLAPDTEDPENPGSIVLFAWKDTDFAARTDDGTDGNQCRINQGRNATFCATQGLIPGQWGLSYGNVDNGLVLRTDKVYFASPQDVTTFLSRITLLP